MGVGGAGGETARHGAQTAVRRRARLKENLVTLCEQSYPEYQLLFGVRDPLDPAIAVVERLKARYPQRDIQLVVDSRVHGSNFKVSNLINIESSARHPWLVLADSDISVAPDYLERSVHR